MNFKRRQFLLTLGISSLFTPIAPVIANNNLSPHRIIKPPKLKLGDTIGFIAPAGLVAEKDIEKATLTFAKLGFKIKLGKHILDRYGYLAGTDHNRAQDIHLMFADPAVKAIIAMRGGWGCNRILPLLNYPLFRSHPKIILGYSDITSLLLAINSRSRLITFHGGVATSTWNDFTVNYWRRILLTGELLTMENSPTPAGKVEIIYPGTVQGKLIGGNLSVITAMIGSAYLPSFYNNILFLEDIGEDVYRIDRMLTQLQNFGILNQISGFIFGQCTNCQSSGKQTFTLREILQQYIQPLKIPAWYGSMIGHIQDKFTIPVGLNVEIDADQGSIKMLETAVS
ncbi:MAG: LD-carboxypeptidase [Sphaerospermopsis sp. SIO1G1]|nr:LD-carboxypeptidase [Sphaerospermopsis sp. SIO1G1]